MKNKFQHIIIFLISIIITSCSPRIPFTQAIRDQYKLNDQDLKHIQFYLSDPVVLKRGFSKENEKSTEEGTLVIKSAKDVQQVIFKANTPGAVVDVFDNNKITIAFEDGIEKHLVFGSNNSRQGYYYLQALDWKDNKGKINYGGNTYFSNPGSDKSILLFRMKSLKNVKVDETVVKGKKVN